MFTAALFTLVKSSKQLKCPSVEDRVKKMLYAYTMEYYSATRKGEILPFSITWMDLENIIS